MQGLAGTTAHGYVFDAERGSDNGFWVQFNVRELADVPDPVLPKGFRFRTAEDVSVADAVKAHRDAWYPSSFTETALERVRRTWPYRPDLHVLIEAPGGSSPRPRSSGWTTRREPLSSSPWHPPGLPATGVGHRVAVARDAAGPGGRREPHAGRLSGAPAHPAARNMYYGVGFRELTRDVPQIKAAR